MNITSKDSLITSDEIANMFTSKFSEVDLSLFAASEQEAIGVEHFLVEPKCNQNLLGGTFDFEAFHSQKFFDVEDFSGAIEYDEIKADFNAVHSNLTREAQEETPELLDGKTRLPTCEEFTLDAKPADEVTILDHGSCKVSCVGNVGLGRNSPDFHERDSAAEISNMSSASVPALESTRNQNSPVLDEMTVEELHEAFSSMFGRETSVTDKQWLKCHLLFGLHNQVELDNGLNLVKHGTTSYKIGGKTVCSSSCDSSGSATGSIDSVLVDKTMAVGWHVERKKFADLDTLKTSSEDSKIDSCSLDGGDEALVTQKRQRKPPKRYIEESMEDKSRYCKRKNGDCEVFYKESREKLLSVRSRKRLYPKGFGAAPMVCKDKSFKGSCIQVPFGIPVEEGHTETDTSSWNSEDFKDDRLSSPNEEVDTEPHSARSQDDICGDGFITRGNTQKVSSHRKHHISWTSSEVMKLIEGVSRCGVGRWAEIKRLMFSSSSRRTPVDLKDKWRNLLRASYAQLQCKRKVKQGQKQVSNQVPESVLWRVRELSTTYPYQRERKFKVSCTDSSNFSASTNNILVPLST
ncbi:hypothetical protein ACJW30_08G085200 [Castanea mollissima]